MAYKYIVLVVSLVISFISHRLYIHYQGRLTASAFCKQHGCLPMKAMPQSRLLFGWPMLRQLMKAQKENKFLQLFRELFETNGPTYSFNILGSHIGLTHDMENIKTMLTNIDAFGVGEREHAFSPLLGKGGIFTSDGESWQQSRALVRQALTRSQVADVALFETHLKPLFEAIPSDGTTVDLAPLFFTFTLDVTLDFILGESENPTPIQLKQRKDFGPAFDYAQKGLGNRGNSGWLGYLFFWNKFWRSCRICKSFVDERVAKALQRTSTPTEKADTSRYVLLDEMAKQTRDPAKMQAESLNLMLAGRDTTASLLTIAFHVLPRHPEVEKKLRQDIEQLNGELPSFEELKNLKYLRYFLNECLRLYPIVPANARATMKDTVLPHGGDPDGLSPAYIPKGTEMNYSTYTMHRDKTIYGENAEEFEPERWETIRPGWAYLPFNGGPRICPGQIFALTEASYAIVRILQTYSKLERRDDEPFVEKLALTMSSLHGAKVGLCI